MKTRGRLAKRVIAVLVCATLLIAAIPAGVFSALGNAERGELKVTLFSDIPYFAESARGTGATETGHCEAYNEW